MKLELVIIPCHDLQTHLNCNRVLTGNNERILMITSSGYWLKGWCSDWTMLKCYLSCSSAFGKENFQGFQISRRLRVMNCIYKKFIIIQFLKFWTAGEDESLERPQFTETPREALKFFAVLSIYQSESFKNSNRMMSLSQTFAVLKLQLRKIG